jgi:putative transposase
MNLTFEYKIEPTIKQAFLMDEWLEICRKVYNYALAERRDWIRSRKCDIHSCSIRSEYIIPADAPKITYALQCKSLTQAKKNHPALTLVYSQVLQQVLNTVEKAFVGMWEQGRGFPRFKKTGRMRSMLFPQFAESPINGDGIELPKLGRIRIRFHRPIPNGFVVKQVRVVKRASGWYVMLSLFCDVAVPDINPHGHPLGIDVGLEAFVATSDGELIDRPRFFVDAQHKLKLLNRDVARKLQGSKNQQKARQKVARQYEKIANQRKAFHLQVAHKLCDLATTIYAEDLNLKGLASGMLAKHCLDAGWGMFLNILKWVSYKRGCYFEKINARGTSQLCPVCDVEVPKDLSARIHECPECSYRTNRDVASAQVVLKRGIAALGHRVKKSVEQGEETKPAVKQKRSIAKSRSPRRPA